MYRLELPPVVRSVASLAVSSKQLVEEVLNLSVS